MKKDIFLFGASGFLGKNISLFLAKRNIPFHAITRKECDLRDPKNIEQILNNCRDDAIRIINAAVVNKTTDNSYGSFLDNIAIGHAFHAVAQNRRIASFIHISSFDVYGNTPQNPLTENSCPAPDTWYGLSKIVVEHILSLSPSLRNVLTILRIPGIYALNGADDHSMIARLDKKIRNKQPIRLENEGKSLRDYVNAEDVAQMIEHILRTEKSYGTINVATGESLTIRGIVDALAAYAGTAAVVEHAASSDRTFDIIVDIAKLKAAFPDHCPQTLSKTLQH